MGYYEVDASGKMITRRRRASLTGGLALGKEAGADAGKAAANAIKAGIKKGVASGLQAGVGMAVKLAREGPIGKWLTPTTWRMLAAFVGELLKTATGTGKGKGFGSKKFLTLAELIIPDVCVAALNLPKTWKSMAKGYGNLLKNPSLPHGPFL
jgi:hypothetical protein